MKIRFLLSGLLAVVSASVAGGSQTERRASAAPIAPPFPETWVNGPALSNELLAGKAVFLVFFEET